MEVMTIAVKSSCQDLLEIFIFPDRIIEALDFLGTKVGRVDQLHALETDVHALEECCRLFLGVKGWVLLLGSFQI
jgi:hypothetical protein